MLRKFVRAGKNDDVVQKVELVEANPMYARIKHPDGREANVSLRDLAKYPQAREEVYDEEINDVSGRNDDVNDEGRDGMCDERRQAHELSTDVSAEGGRVVEEDGGRESMNKHDDHHVASENRTSDLENHESPKLRRSERRNKGVPPDRFGF